MQTVHFLQQARFAKQTVFVRLGKRPLRGAAEPFAFFDAEFMIGEKLCFGEMIAMHQPGDGVEVVLSDAFGHDRAAKHGASCIG